MGKTVAAVRQGIYWMEQAVLSALRTARPVLLLVSARCVVMGSF